MAAINKQITDSQIFICSDQLPADHLRDLGQSVKLVLHNCFQFSRKDTAFPKKHYLCRA
jgi:hypothetical protein